MRLSAEKGISWRPPITAIVLEYTYPLTSTMTAARLPPPSSSTTSGGTSMPVLLPICSSVVSNLIRRVWQRHA